MLPRSQSNAEPAHVLQRPSSARAQDVNHILSKKFGDLFMRDPIDSQTICNLRISQGSEDAYHRAYVEKLLKVCVNLLCQTLCPTYFYSYNT